MKREKRALITGITGQDGSYLAEFLLTKGYKVFGLMRRSSTDPLMRIDHLVIPRKITILYGDLQQSGEIKRALEESKPDEIYNLAAQSDVGISFKQPDYTFETNYHGVGRLVNIAMELNPKVRIYQASTSEMFGSTPPPQNEKSPFNPLSPYASAKLRAHEDYVVGYREKHGLFICSGILFNHESPRRGKHFVTRKITYALAKISCGIQDSLSLGNLESKRDWGFAGDYVEAMWLMLQQPKPRDFVIATGEAHGIKEFVEIAAGCLNKKITWKGKAENTIGRDQSGKVIVKVNKEFYRPNDVNYLLGDASKARKILGWKPKVKFKELVRMMVEADLALVKKDSQK